MKWRWNEEDYKGYLLNYIKKNKLEQSYDKENPRIALKFQYKNVIIWMELNRLIKQISIIDTTSLSNY